MQGWESRASGGGTEEILLYWPCFWVDPEPSSYFGGHCEGKSFGNEHHGFSEGRFILEKFGDSVSGNENSGQYVTSIMTDFQIVSSSQQIINQFSLFFSLQRIFPKGEPVELWIYYFLCFGEIGNTIRKVNIIQKNLCFLCL